jgi:hypothetical protein
MQGVIDAISTWTGAGGTLVSAVMGAVGGAILIAGAVAINKRIKRSRRGYYR